MKKIYFITSKQGLCFDPAERTWTDQNDGRCTIATLEEAQGLKRFAIDLAGSLSKLEIEEWGKVLCEDGEILPSIFIKSYRLETFEEELARIDEFFNTKQGA